MDLRSVLNKLKEMGKISDQDIIDVVGHSQEMKNLVTALHILLCFKDHDTECNFYKEELYDSMWTKPIHAEWLMLAQDFLLKFELSEVDGVMAVSSAVDVIETRSPASLHILKTYLTACRDLVDEKPEAQDS